MHDHRSIGRLLYALAPLVASGCGSDLGEFTENVCLDGSASLGELAPVEGTDFVARRDLAGELGQAWGARCATATDVAACEAALAALPFEAPLFREGGMALVEFDFVFTRGDEVGRAGTAADMVALLATIDTPSEAALVALANGHHLPCDESNVRREGSTFVLLAKRGDGCPSDIEHYEIVVTADGKVTEGESEVIESGNDGCAAGRRPSTLRSRTRRHRSLGDHLATMAHLEAASVPAFEQLAAELIAHRAPCALVEGAWQARHDEIRHARVTTALARHHGGRPVRAVVGPRHVRSLAEVARENAIEGCVRETFGALVAIVQSGSARDPLLRRALGRIALDETRHAELAWATHAWLMRRLGARDRRMVRDAQRQAFDTLRRDVAVEVPRDVRLLAGTPDAEASVMLARALDVSLC